MNNLVISIKKNNRIIGNCCYFNEGYTIPLFIKVKSIIDNYNKYLSKITDNNLFVLRLFQEQDEQATIIKDTAIVDDLSEEFLKDVCPSLNIYGNSKSDNEFGKIAISNSDMEKNI
jgi:hypothetical protein